MQKNKLLFFCHFLLTIILYYVFSFSNVIYLKFFPKNHSVSMYYSVLFSHGYSALDPNIQRIENFIKKIPGVLSHSSVAIDNDPDVKFQDQDQDEKIEIVKYKLVLKDNLGEKTINLMTQLITKMYAKENIGEVYFATKSIADDKAQIKTLASKGENLFFISCFFLILLIISLWLFCYQSIIKKTLYVQFLCENIIGVKYVLVKLLLSYNALLFLFMLPFMYFFHWKIIEWVYAATFFIICYMQILYYKNKRLFE